MHVHVCENKDMDRPTCTNVQTDIQALDGIIHFINLYRIALRCLAALHRIGLITFHSHKIQNCINVRGCHA